MNSTKKHQPIIKAKTPEEFTKIQQAIITLPNIVFEQITEADGDHLAGLFLKIQPNNKTLYIPNNVRSIADNKAYFPNFIFDINPGSFNSIVFVDKEGMSI